MLSKRIIPCLDVTAGRVVKGVNFVGLRDAGDPVEIAKRYDTQGADELTFLDITATSDGRDLILHIIEDVASQVFIPLTVGGGVRTVADVRRLLNAGADKVSMNSSAVASPAEYLTAQSYVANITEKIMLDDYVGCVWLARLPPPIAPANTVCALTPNPKLQLTLFSAPTRCGTRFSTATPPPAARGTPT